jgi:hypothetical protein
MTPTLKQLVAAATPGPWKARRRNEDDSGFVQAPEPTKPYGTEILGEDYFPHRSRAADVNYIARLDPQTVLAVYEALQALINEASDMRDCLIDRGVTDHDTDGIKAANEALDKAESALKLLNGETK